MRYNAHLLLIISLFGASALLIHAQDLQFAFNDKCPRQMRNNNDRGCRCIRIRDFDDLRGAIRRIDDGECKCFNPFSITKSPQERPIEMDDMRRVTIKCREFGQCIIQGQGTHITIEGEESEVAIAGFKFVGATSGAVAIAEDTGTDRKDTREQILCNNDFVGNNNYRSSGGAIFVGPNSRAYVSNSYFAENTASRMGGAISSADSTVIVLESTFLSNTASIGGAISSNRPTSVLVLADNRFDGNNAGLGPSYGPAVAANGIVRDFGGNAADPNNFMCLHCNLVPGNRPIGADEDEEEYQEKIKKINIQRLKAGEFVGFSAFNPDARPNRDVDLEFELNRYRRNPDFEKYETYADDRIWGPFNIKLYFGKGYQWQEQYKDLNMCLQSKYSEQKVEGREEPLELFKCDDDEDRQRFVAVGKTIRIDEDRRLCMTYEDVRAIRMQKCDGSIYQQWDRLQGEDRFKLSPVTDHRRCMTNHHHPRNYERIYLEWCEVAEDADTVFWEVKWLDGDEPDPVTPEPTAEPTRSPTTKEPTRNPTSFPTYSPTISKQPSTSPSSMPSSNPSSAPSGTPTFSPSISKIPSVPPSSVPSGVPSGRPSPGPTHTPSATPTGTPSKPPTPVPTGSPTETPSSTPSTPAPTEVPPQCGRLANFAACPSPIFCCSAEGYCGLGDRYCGVGCQSGPMCANPVPATVGAKEFQKDEKIDVAGPSVDVENEQDNKKTEESDKYSFVPVSTGIESIHEDTSKCGSTVTYLKNALPRTRNCASPHFNAENLCNRNLANMEGKVSDVCCDQCANFRESPTVEYSN